MTAVVFPGQGSQYVGMAKDLWEMFPECKDIVKRADGILGYNISEIMFFGSEEVLRKTQHTQPAIFLHSYIISCLAKVDNVRVVAGHSLGEYSALCYAGALTFEDALQVVHHRGKIMQDMEERSGSMVAVVGAPDDGVVKLVAEASKFGVAQIANYNAPGQVVISGDISAMDKIVEVGKMFGAKMVKKLKVSGAFHSPLMKQGEAEFAMVLKDIKIEDAKIPVCMNVTAKEEVKKDTIRMNAILQLTNPVRWSQSVTRMKEMGVKTYWEFGPQRVLQGLIKRIDTSAEIFNLDTAESIFQLKVRNENKSCR